MGNYVTVDEVLDFLYITFELSDPTAAVNRFKSWINNRINENEVMLEEKCRTVWRQENRTDLLKRTVVATYRDAAYRLSFYLPYYPVISVQAVFLDLGAGLQLLPADAYTFDQYGVYVKVRRFMPYSQFAICKVSYTYGYGYVPADVKGAVLRMVALDCFRMGVITPYLQRQPTSEMIEGLEKYVKEVIARYSHPQVLPI